MNRIATFITLTVLSVFLVSCDKNDLSEPAPVQLEVNIHNISGQWQLIYWNGNEMADGTYVYMDIVRNDETYTMYQNVDSFADVPRVVTGRYKLYEVEGMGMAIRGNYDYSGEEWSARYIITSLTEDTMKWVDKNDQTQIQEFVRVQEIPLE